MRVLKKDIKPLLKLLETVEIPINYHRARKKKEGDPHGSKMPAGKGRSVLLGKIPRRNDLSNFTKQHPEIYQEVKRLAQKYVDFPVSSFMLNKNYQTQKHYDPKNIKESVIFSFGDFKGGELIVEGRLVDTYMKTVKMDGSKSLHWNLPITEGTKYSLVFFNS
jgi:hypothetical protein